MTDGAWCVLIFSLGSRVSQHTVCTVSVWTWNTISQTLGNSGLEHGKIIYLVLVSASSYVYGCTYIWQPEENLECHLPGTAIYLFETVILIGLEGDKLSMSASTSQGSSCLCLPSVSHHTWNSPCLSMCHPIASPFLTFSHFPGTELWSLCPYILMLWTELLPQHPNDWFNCYFFVMLLNVFSELVRSGVVHGSHIYWPSAPFPFLFFPTRCLCANLRSSTHSEKPVFSCLQEETQFSEQWEIIEPNFIFC